MSTTTALVQRAASTVKNVATTATPTSSSRDLARSDDTTSKPTLSSSLATATSVLPALNLTPLKSITTPQKPSTPQQQPTPAAPTPGQWQHPRMQEIIRRQNATRFDSSNLRVIGMNAAFLVASVLVPLFGAKTLPSSWIRAIEPYALYALNLLRAFFILNVSLAVLPAFRQLDSCEDVPLTPSQRRLLGLPPMSRPATPQEQQQYATPPRYSRSATPQSATTSLRGNASDSPLGGRGSPFDSSQLRQGVSGSPRPSPLGSSLRSGERDESRRLSYNRSSPLSTPEFDAVGNVSTPTKNSKASVPLNSKWLYDKGRASSRASLNGLGAFGGSGSIFT
ncbi:hypothetical protein BAUCODRAFT_36408 [Baudoinia panamericana UAMH 10762]|uniref:Nuclear pore complex component n=1 Tax=Baudoinia panamericana (strain UAMH 10762) TaxID=717646 RepID=M2MR61_BAUPA|nr:uncharacterized protein BAUCODRAFT_36408 [Baudoinia panamericana UAMH 10762]EMC93948.1 hypothetical protein BAUCODRAFT_36408 [Baudoinia panamericana UAMH 10762]